MELVIGSTAAELAISVASCGGHHVATTSVAGARNVKHSESDERRAG
jgi:hypothetical protein